MNINRRKLPNPGGYVRLWKALKAAPPDQALKPNDAWYYGDTVGEALKKFSRAVNSRINSRGDVVKRGKLDDEFYFWQERRDQWAIRDIINHRARVYQFETKACRARFGHLLSRYED